MKSVTLVLLIALLAAPAAAATFDVNIANSAFSPATVTIKVGDTVRWTNNDVIPHTATSGSFPKMSGLFDSGTLNPKGTYSFTFTQAGTVDYGCWIHSPMTAKVIVEGVTPPPPPPTAAISGSVSGPAAAGTQMTLQGAASRSTFTASNGTYSFTNLPTGLYTVFPSRPGFTFTPPSRDVNLGSSSVSGIDFGSDSAGGGGGTDGIDLDSMKVKIKTKKPDRDKLKLKAVLTTTLATFPTPEQDDVTIRVGNLMTLTVPASSMNSNSSGTKFSFKDATTSLKLKVSVSATAGGIIKLKLKMKKVDLNEGPNYDPEAPVLVTVTYGPFEASAVR